MERSRHLHNFNLPPGLTWGRQTLWRCVNVDQLQAPHVVPDDEYSSDSSQDDQKPSAVQPRSSDDGQRKLGSELNSSQPFAPIKATSGIKEIEENSPLLKSKSRKKLTSKASPLSPPPIKIHSEDGLRLGKKSTRPRRNLEKKEERPKFSIQLSRNEIEEDFIAMTGKTPPRNPNKPPKSFQALSPGLWLSEVHPDRYKANENGMT